MPLDPNATIHRSPAPVQTTVGDEIVLMSLESGECFGLGETGSEVWRLLDQPATLGQLVLKLRETYDAPADVIQQDVAELLEHMLRLGLIRVEAA